MSGSTDPTTLANGFAQNSGVWFPRFQVFIDKAGVGDPTATPATLVPTALSAQVQKSNWYQADRHKITFALYADPAYGPAFWLQNGDLSLDTLSILVQISFDAGATYTEVFRGFVDKLIIDPIKGIVTLSGRNIIGFLIDFRPVYFDTNPSVGQVLTDIFKNAGLGPPTFDPGFPSDQPYGRQFNDEQSSGSTAHHSTLNPMDVAMAICQQVGGTMYEIQGQTHFKLEIDGNNDFTFLIQVSQPTYEDGVTKLSPSNVTSLTLEHDLNISQWQWYMQAVNYDNTGKADGNTVNYPPDNVGAALSKPFPLQSANKNQNDNTQYAQSMYEEYMMHEFIIVAKVGGPQLINLKLSDKIGINGFGDPVDGWFAIDSIEHSIDFNRGYVGTVRARYGRFAGA